jgi:O-antigen/teichoic acid export membrane protein
MLRSRFVRRAPALEPNAGAAARAGQRKESEVQGLADVAVPHNVRGFLIRAIAGSGALQAVGVLLAFVVGVQLARGLGVEGYGYYGVAMAVIAIASVPCELASPKLVTREVSAASGREVPDLPRLFGVLRWADRITLLVALPAAVLLALGAYAFLARDTIALTAALVLGAPIIPLVALTKTRGAALQGLHAIVLGQAPFQVVRPLLFSLMLLGLFIGHRHASVADVMAINTVTALAGLLAAHFWLRDRLPRERPPRLSESGSTWFASAVPIALTESMRTLQAQMLIPLLGIFASAGEVGLFRVAVSISAIVAAPLALVTGVMSPMFARLVAEHDRAHLERLSLWSAQIMTGLVLALAVPMILLGPGLLGFLFGPDFTPAYPALVLLCIGQFINALFGCNSAVLVMSGHERRVTRAVALSVVGSVAALFVLVPELGIVGAACASIVSILIWNVLLWSDTRRLLGADTSILSMFRR